MLGTLLYTYCILSTICALSSPVPTLTRRARISMLLFAAMCVTSFNFSLVTKKTFMAVALNGAFMLKLAEMTWVWRLGTLYIEFMFGVMRCRGNTDGLTLQMLQYYLQKIQILWDVCVEQGFHMVGRDTRGYRAAVHSGPGRCKIPLMAESVSDEDFLAILNQTAGTVQATLRRLGWKDEDMSPFIRTYSAVTELADAAANYFKLPEPTEEDRLTHDFQEGELESADDTKGTPQKAAFCATQFKLAAGALAPDEANADEFIADLAASGDNCADAVLADKPAEPLTASSEGVMLHAMYDSLPAVSCDHAALVRHLAKMSQEALGLIVLDKHQGIGNRKTIAMRLADMSGHARAACDPTWILHDIVYVKGLNHFARLVVTYQKSYGNVLRSRGTGGRRGEGRRIEKEGGRVRGVRERTQEEGG